MPCDPAQPLDSWLQQPPRSTIGLLATDKALRSVAPVFRGAKRLILLRLRQQPVDAKIESVTRVYDAGCLDRLGRVASRSLGAKQPTATCRDPWCPGPASVLGAVLLAALLLLASCSARTGPEAPLAYRQGEDAFRLADYDRATRAYRIFIDTDQRDDLVPRAYYRLAFSEFRRGQAESAIDVLDELDRRYPKRKWAQVYELRGDIEEARANDISAVRWWEMAWQVAEGDQRVVLRRQLANRLARMDDATLVAARSVLTSEELQAYVDARLRGGAAVPPSGADTAAPPSRPQRVETQRPGAPGRAVAVDENPVDRPLIGCLVPRTGRYAPYGQRSLNGIRLALGSEADRLVVRDTQGEPQLARAALDELIANPRIVAVVGPLRSKVAGAVAVRAERAGLPLLVLSQREGLSGTFVMQPSMTYQRQAAEIAEYAVRGLGLQRLAVLYPYAPYGAALSEAFATEVRLRGGDVVGTLVYGPDAQEFSAESLSVQKWIADQGLQAVFIPDSVDRALPLASALRRARPGLGLLGSNGWYDEAALGQAGPGIDGAVFVDGFFVASRRPGTRRFVTAYEDEFQSTPGILEAQAYDAALLVKRAFDAGAKTRAGFFATLRTTGPFEGAGGSIRFRADGVERDLFLLRVGDGAVTEVERAILPTSASPETAPAAAPH